MLPPHCPAMRPRTGRSGFAAPTQPKGGWPCSAESEDFCQQPSSQSSLQALARCSAVQQAGGGRSVVRAEALNAHFLSNLGSHPKLRHADGDTCSLCPLCLQLVGTFSDDPQATARLHDHTPGLTAQTPCHLQKATQGHDQGARPRMPSASAVEAAQHRCTGLTAHAQSCYSYTRKRFYSPFSRP